MVLFCSLSYKVSIVFSEIISDKGIKYSHTALLNETFSFALNYLFLYVTLMYKSTEGFIIQVLKWKQSSFFNSLPLSWLGTQKTDTSLYPVSAQSSKEEKSLQGSHKPLPKWVGLSQRELRYTNRLLNQQKVWWKSAVCPSLSSTPPLIKLWGQETILLYLHQL